MDDAALVPALPCETLRWRVDESRFDFETTAEVEPIRTAVGQDMAVEALRFGLEINAPGQNVFVRGLTGTGRSTLIRNLLEEIKPACPVAKDRCYVHNFQRPDRPHLLTLERGSGDRFRRALDEVIDFIRKDFGRALGSDVLKQRTKEVERATAAKVEAITKPFDAELRDAGLTLVMAQVGPTTRQLIVPLGEEGPIPPERLEAMVAEGKLSEDELKAIRTKIQEFGARLSEIGERVQEIQGESNERMRGLVEDETRTLLEGVLGRIRRDFPSDEVREFLNAVVDDMVDEGLPRLNESTAFTERYRVNPILVHGPDEGCPVVVENAPSVQTLLGTIDRSLSEEQAMMAPHMLVHGGSLLRADGGYIILEARDVLTEHGAWRSLVRTLRSGQIQMVAPDGPVTWRVPPIKPEPIPVNLKVVLLGDAGLYYQLDALDPDFPHLFKVLADFDDAIERNEQGLGYYAGVLARISREEGLCPFDRSAVARLCEHGARIASREDRMTTRFGRLADLAREACFLAKKEGREATTGEHVERAVARTKQRGSLPTRRFNEQVAKGALLVRTRGRQVGQINGLAVIQAGPLTYGFPSRLTATIGPGRRGTVNVEGEASLSGRIHTKGFHIINGLLRTILRTEHPLTFNASIAFEQSYGGVDGDSASGAETVCLLSALTDIAIRQDLAMTGAVDQHGNVQPIGAANEKIEGFFDTCKIEGLTGDQGVIIPQANAGDLMLRQDVVDACKAGQFAIYAVSRIEEAISLFTGMPAGRREGDEPFPEGSFLEVAVRKAREYYERAARRK